MFRLLLHIIHSFTLVFSDYSLFKTIVYQPYTSQTKTRLLYKRSGGPQCSNYAGINEPGNVLFLDADKQWIISNNFTTEHNEDDPCCDVIKGDSTRPIAFSYPRDLKMCGNTQGFEVVGTISLTQDGDNCNNKFQEMLRESKHDEYVFMSKMTRNTGVPNGDEEDKVDMGDVCSEEKKDTEEQTMIFGFIGFSAAVLLCLLICIICMKIRGVMCFKTGSQESTIHQNELYGNTSNEDYFAERYDTMTVDTNQYYEEEYEA